MFQEILAQAKQRTDRPPMRFKQGEVHWVIDLDEKGQHIKTTSLIRKVDKKQVGDQMFVPVVKRSNDINPNFFMEDAVKIFDSVKGKAFQELIKKCATDTNNPNAIAVDSFMDLGILGDVIPRSDLKPEHQIGFRVNGAYVFHDPELQKWWSKQLVNRNASVPIKGVCSITGEQADITHIGIYTVRMPGQEKQGMFFSSDAESTQHFQKKQNHNASVSEESFQLIIQEFQRMIDENRFIRVGNDLTIFVVGAGIDNDYDSNCSDPILSILEGPKNWKTYSPDYASYINTKKNITILAVVQKESRIRIVARFTDFEKFIGNVALWYDAVTVPGLKRTPGLNDIVANCFSESRTYTNGYIDYSKVNKIMNAGMMMSFLQAIYYNGDLPTNNFKELMSGINRWETFEEGRWILKITPLKRAAMKAYWVYSTPDREERVRRSKMPGDVDSVAFQAGKMFKLFNDIQAEYYRIQKMHSNYENNDKSAISRNITDIYFQNALRAPRQTFAQINMDMRQKYLGTLRNKNPKLYHFFEKQLAEMNLIVTGNLPIQFNINQSSQFILGYSTAIDEQYTQMENAKAEKERKANEKFLQEFSDVDPEDTNIQDYDGDEEDDDEY